MRRQGRAEKERADWTEEQQWETRLAKMSREGAL